MVSVLCVFLSRQPFVLVHLTCSSITGTRAAFRRAECNTYVGAELGIEHPSELFGSGERVCT